MTETKREWTKDEIRELLAKGDAKSDEAVRRGLLRIYERQTADEQQEGSTKYNNNVGYNAADSRIMTELAVCLIRYKKLFPNQIQTARRILLKYSGQLLKVAKK